MKKMILIFITTSFLFNSYCLIYTFHAEDLVNIIDNIFNMNSELKIFHNKHQYYFYILLYIYCLISALIFSYNFLYKNSICYKIFKEIFYYFFAIIICFILSYFISFIHFLYCLLITKNTIQTQLRELIIILLFLTPIFSLIYIKFRIIYKFSYNFKNFISKISQLINKFYTKIFRNCIFIIFSLFFIYINLYCIYVIIIPVTIISKINNLYYQNVASALYFLLKYSSLIFLLIFLLLEIYHLFKNKSFVLSHKYKDIYYHFLTISFWYSIQFPLYAICLRYGLVHNSSLNTDYISYFFLFLILTTPIISIIFSSFLKKYRHNKINSNINSNSKEIS